METLTRLQAIGNISRHWIERLPPAYFSLVMATGIVSIACELVGLHWVAILMLPLNVIAFVVLWLMTGLRLIGYSDLLLKDLAGHASGPGYFTAVASTGVLGVQIMLLTGSAGWATGLWVFTLVLWLAVTYAFFTAVIVHPAKPSLTKGLSGIWLIASVATQSVAVLGAMIATHLAGHQQTILFVSLLFYLMGCMLYINIIALVFYRLTFILLQPASFTPAYWVNMGATAIATQAGATLLLHADASPLLTELIPFLKGFTLFFWAAGTWWIPLLLCLGLWTHWLRGIPIHYSPLFWGAVFPVGMYTASTWQLAEALGLDGLKLVPAIVVYVALLAWILAFAGMARRLLGALVAVVRVVLWVRPA